MVRWKVAATKMIVAANCGIGASCLSREERGGCDRDGAIDRDVRAVFW
jgi:hypothetical protein